jgi:hypothetical protein
MGPLWAFKSPESLKTNKISLKMGNVRLYLLITITI